MKKLISLILALMLVPVVFAEDIFPSEAYKKTNIIGQSTHIDDIQGEKSYWIDTAGRRSMYAYDQLVIFDFTNIERPIENVILNWDGTKQSNNWLSFRPWNGIKFDGDFKSASDMNDLYETSIPFDESWLYYGKFYMWIYSSRTFTTKEIYLDVTHGNETPPIVPEIPEPEPEEEIIKTFPTTKPVAIPVDYSTERTIYPYQGFTRGEEIDVRNLENYGNVLSLDIDHKFDFELWFDLTNMDVEDLTLYLEPYHISDNIQMFVYDTDVTNSYPNIDTSLIKDNKIKLTLKRDFSMKMDEVSLHAIVSEKQQSERYRYHASELYDETPYAYNEVILGTPMYELLHESWQDYYVVNWGTNNLFVFNVSNINKTITEGLVYWSGVMDDHKKVYFKYWDGTTYQHLGLLGWYYGDQLTRREYRRTLPLRITQDMIVDGKIYIKVTGSWFVSRECYLDIETKEDITVLPISTPDTFNYCNGSVVEEGYIFSFKENCSSEEGIDVTLDKTTMIDIFKQSFCLWFDIFC